MNPAAPSQLEMFNFGANAAALAGNCSPRYVCPLCMRSHRTFDGKELTREHVPAESLGGTLLLTCRLCNNEAGRRLQGHQVERERQESFWRGDGDGKMNFELHTAGGTVRGEIESSGAPRRFIIQSSRTDPNSLANWPPPAGQESSAYTLGRRYNWQASRIADLRDAYLWAFAQYGYSLIAQPSYNWVRKAIQEGGHSNTKWAINLDDPFTGEQQRINGRPIILVTSKPEGALVIANGSRGTILPTPHCQNPYAELEETCATLTFLTKVIPVPRTLLLVWDHLPREAL